MDLSSLYTYQNRATKMSTPTVASLSYITRETLSAKILSQPLSSSSPIAVVDVRDSDHVGGHIAGSIHAPTPALDWKLPELVRQLRDKETVVFHCALSQVRGPSAALAYMRERNRLVGKEAEGQKVLVLDGGFVKWQEK